VGVSSQPFPINVHRLAVFLQGYPVGEKLPLLNGLQHGFPLHSSLRSDPDKYGYENHPSAMEHREIVTAKLSEELVRGRIAGPFTIHPFPDFIVSPLGLVPKREAGAFRLIHDLSFPKHNSVNSNINPQFTSVQYELLDRCVEHIMSLGQGCLIAKGDLKDAFRILPVAPSDYRLLGFVWDSQFYYDRALPMGCSVSCATFERLSRALQWIVSEKFRFPHVSHILDDFIFFGPPDSSRCRNALFTFRYIAASVGVPLNEDKTVLPSTNVVLHGIEVNTSTLTLQLPEDKQRELVRKLTEVRRRKRVKLVDLQSLLGSLNFACRAIVPGRPFMRRLIDLSKGVTNPRHFVKLSREARRDINAWLIFLANFNGRVMCLPNAWTASDTLRLYSDACLEGAAAVCGSEWFYVAFPTSWENRHITVKELLPIVLAIQAWGAVLANRRILFFCDNLSVTQVINNQTSKDCYLMNLLRKLVVLCLQFNIDLRAKHIPGKLNVVSDCLSRFQFAQARQWAPWLSPDSLPVNQEWHTW